MTYICKNPWTTLFVWGDGNVTHCCYSNIGSLGNIKKENLMEIWTGKKLNLVRDNISRGNYLKAGCEHFCRSFRWNNFYGFENSAREIPEGLGRLEDIDPPWAVEGPQILGFGIDWRCNLKCRHCLASRTGKGVSREAFANLKSHVEKSHFLRFMGGEFTINSECLEIVRDISALPKQPSVFFSTNGQESISNLQVYLGGLKGFHLKFSLEGLGKKYEYIRTGGTWLAFEKNLDEAILIFQRKRQEGLDWRIYLNFCVMKSNFSDLPAILNYAISKNIPLVLNTLNGMRHIDENMFMFGSASPSLDDIKKTEIQCRKVLSNAGNYCFKNELEMHLDYIFRCAMAKKLNLPKWFLVVWAKIFRYRFCDWSLYSIYKIRMNPISFLFYFIRKVNNKLRRMVFYG